jgi:hypothetical protein
MDFYETWYEQHASRGHDTFYNFSLSALKYINMAIRGNFWGGSDSSVGS